MTPYLCRQYCSDLKDHMPFMYERGFVYCSVCRKTFAKDDCVGMISNRCPCCASKVRRNARSVYAQIRVLRDKPRY